jgi:hypothetical protein
MTREQMIEWLISNDLAADGWASSEDKDAWFAMILRSGFAGYETQTDAELAQEITERKGE